MPANLNALLRYRTIDIYLHGNTFGASIEKLIDLCSVALTENRGKITSVSERTIRDDIRVMRSDMLGFNAPIIFENGKYYYDPQSFTIAHALMPDSKQITNIYNLLVQEQLRNESKLLAKAIQLLHQLLPDGELQEFEEPIVKEATRSYESTDAFEAEVSKIIPDAPSEKLDLLQEEDFKTSAKKAVYLLGKMFERELSDLKDDSKVVTTNLTWNWLWSL